MSRFIKNRKSKFGKSPGSFIFIGRQKAEKVKISIIDYDSDYYDERIINQIEECSPYKEKSTITWINVDGIHKVDVIQKLGECFSVHPLVLEDILNTDHRPKIEDHDDYLYLVLKMPYYVEKKKRVVIEQISLILGSNYILSFQEVEGDVFGPIRDRLKQNKGKLRKLKADYLLYALLDTIIDNYLFVVEQVSERIEMLEDKLINEHDKQLLDEIYSLKRETMFLRRSVYPVKEIVHFITRGNSKLIDENTELYFRDIYDHIIHVVELIDTFREMLSEMFNMYTSNVSNKMNETMKTLTIMATIFIPLTFIAGIYGMNFEYMPELKWKYGYFTIWIIMLSVGFTMVNYFKKKKWF